MRRAAGFLGALAAALGGWGCGLPHPERGLTWSGDVVVSEPQVVAEGESLTILPGTTVSFRLPEPATDAERRPWLLVRGRLEAVGTEERPIRFRPAEPRQSELDDMIQIMGARPARLRHCVFEGGPWGLHVHETPVTVERCAFRGNYGGVRFQGGELALRGNAFEGNVIGVRCLKASPVLEDNAFVGNLTGIFFREGVDAPVVRRNHFEDREYDIKLGEAQSLDVDAAGNWWVPPEGLDERIYDGRDSEGVGLVRTAPPLATAPVRSP